MGYVTAAKPFNVYIPASARNGTLYVGSTDDLGKRIWEHKNDSRPGFTSRHRVKVLVYHEAHESRASAFQRERQIKKWNRAWKLRLIEDINPEWRDLYDTLNG